MAKYVNTEIDESDPVMKDLIDAVTNASCSIVSFARATRKSKNVIKLMKFTDHITNRLMCTVRKYVSVNRDDLHEILEACAEAVLSDVIYDRFVDQVCKAGLLDVINSEMYNNRKRDEFVRELFADEHVTIEYVPSQKN